MSSVHRTAFSINSGPHVVGPFVLDQASDWYEVRDGPEVLFRRSLPARPSRVWEVAFTIAVLQPLLVRLFLEDPDLDI